MKAIVDFASRLGAKLALDASLILEKKGRYFLLNKRLLRLVHKDFFYAGAYLGKVKNGKFFPSFYLLAMLATCDGNRIVVGKKASWLFICGRDVLGKGVLSVYGSKQKGEFTLVLNEYGECLGFGRIIGKLSLRDMEVVVRNVSDVGDFLRREH